MTTAAITHNNRTTIIHGPAVQLAPAILGHHLATIGPDPLPDGCHTNHYPAPRSVTDAATWHYVLHSTHVEARRPAGPGRWAPHTRIVRKANP